jgi:hypothetical protein
MFYKSKAGRACYEEPRMGEARETSTLVNLKAVFKPGGRIIKIDGGMD